MARTVLKVLLNEPIVLDIGTEETPYLLEIKEPMQDDLGRMLTVMQLSISKFLKDNAKLIATAWKGGDVSKIDLELAAIADVCVDLVAAVMEKDQAYVRAHVSPRQQAAIVESFLEVLDWKLIRSFFQKAMTNWKAVSIPTNGNVEAPSWSQNASPTSPGPSPS